MHGKPGRNGARHGHGGGTAAPAGVVSDCLLPPVSCYAPALFRVEYGIQPLLDRGIDGRGETVTVLAVAPPPGAPSRAPRPPAPRQARLLEVTAASDIRQDLAAFDGMFRLPTARIQVVTTLAGAGSPWKAADEEVQDTEIVHTVAPAAALRVVLLPSNALDSAATATADMLAGLRLAVSGTDVALISFSLGEHYFTKAQVTQMHSILLGAAAHHVTVIAGSGDNGGFSDADFGDTAVKEVSLPASDPLVLAAGGTTLNGNLSVGFYISETAWNGQAGLSWPAEHRGAASATCTPVPPIRTASTGSRRRGACPTWPVRLIRRAAGRSSSPAAARGGSCRPPAPAPPRRCGEDSWRWPTSTPITTSASSTPPSTASPAAPATTRRSMTLLPVATS